MALEDHISLSRRDWCCLPVSVTTTCADYFSSCFPLAFLPLLPLSAAAVFIPYLLFTNMLSPYFDLLLLPTLLCTHLLTILISATYPVVHASPHRSYFRYLPCGARISLPFTYVSLHLLCTSHCLDHICKTTPFMPVP
jgi:hypothetical protein